MSSRAAPCRKARLLEDKAAPIRDIWSMLNNNLAKSYRPTENLTIDEQLYPYKGRTKFTQYIPSKPAKYGIKVWWICDSQNHYPLNGLIYTGQSTTGRRDVNQGERVVKLLTAPYKNSGRNITMDNFFTSLPLAKSLLSWKLTIVGTLRNNKPYIPKRNGSIKFTSNIFYNIWLSRKRHPMLICAEEKQIRSCAVHNA